MVATHIDNFFFIIILVHTSNHDSYSLVKVILRQCGRYSWDWYYNEYCMSSWIIIIFVQTYILNLFNTSTILIFIRQCRGSSDHDVWLCSTSCYVLHGRRDFTWELPTTYRMAKSQASFSLVCFIHHTYVILCHTMNNNADSLSST